MEKPFYHSHYSTTKPRIPFDLLKNQDLLGNKIHTGIIYNGSKSLKIKEIDVYLSSPSLIDITNYYKVNVKGNIVFVIYCRNDLSSHNYSGSSELTIKKCSHCDMKNGKLYLIDIPIHHLSKFSYEMYNKFGGYYNLVSFTIDDLFNYPVYSSNDFHKFVEHVDKPFEYLKEFHTISPINPTILSSHMGRHNNVVGELDHLFGRYDNHLFLHRNFITPFHHTNPVCRYVSNTNIGYTKYKFFAKWKNTMDSLSKFEFSMTPEQLKTVWKNRYTDQIDF